MRRVRLCTRLLCFVWSFDADVASSTTPEQRDLFLAASKQTWLRAHPMLQVMASHDGGLVTWEEFEVGVGRY